jgi:hypothetical protein
MPCVDQSSRTVNLSAALAFLPIAMTESKAAVPVKTERRPTPPIPRFFGGRRC